MYKKKMKRSASSPALMRRETSKEIPVVTESYLLIQQIASSRQLKHQRTLIGLGLNKIGRIRVVPNNPCFLGMLRCVAHLIRIKVIEEYDENELENGILH